MGLFGPPATLSLVAAYSFHGIPKEGKATGRPRIGLGF